MVNAPPGREWRDFCESGDLGTARMETASGLVDLLAAGLTSSSDGCSQIPRASIVRRKDQHALQGFGSGILLPQHALSDRQVEAGGDLRGVGREDAAPQLDRGGVVARMRFEHREVSRRGAVFGAGGQGGPVLRGCSFAIPAHLVQKAKLGVQLRVGRGGEGFRFT